MGSLGLEALCQVPWQQIGDAADGVLGDSGEYGSEIVLRVDAGELGRTDERVDGSGALAAGVGRQFIMPEFWCAKSLSPTHFIH